MRVRVILDFEADIDKMFIESVRDHIDWLTSREFDRHKWNKLEVTEVEAVESP